MSEVFLVVDGMVAPNCPKCGCPPKYRRDGHGVHMFSCCGTTGADAKSVHMALAAWWERAKPADVGKLWRKAMGVADDEERKDARLKKLMNNGAVVKKKLNGFHDGRLMP